MSNPIRRRLEKLEEATAGGPSIYLILRRLIRPGSDGEATAAEFGATVVHRQPGESEEAFIDRASAEAMAGNTSRKVPRVILSEDDANL